MPTNESGVEEPDLNDEELRRWVQMAVDAADDKLGRDTEAFYVGGILGITDWFVVTSGNNPRQVRAIVDEIEEQLTVFGGLKPARIEGKDNLSWVLMDYGAFVVHVFSTEAREYYDLERLWKDVPRLSDVA
ncbi:MAG: ribosome silencing factor [Acidimicrobiia bacterium]|nr:ribosome silencing factor [Acidimicrobiia bacterium]